MAEKTLAQLRTNVERLGARLSENLSGLRIAITYGGVGQETLVGPAPRLDDGARPVTWNRGPNPTLLRFTEHSRDLGLVDSFASGSGGGSGKYLESGAVLTAAGMEETKRMLVSKRESERMEGLKRVIAMMTKNLPVTSFFPLVTSLLSSTTPLQARSLISLYIVHCASRAPELALLSINAYQKDLSDPNPLVRAGAITTLSSMQLDDIRELVGLAIAKGARDTSWYVRRATADAVRALYVADPTPDNQAALLPTLTVLLDSASPLTVGAALAAWEETCPAKWELLHRNYRRYCGMLMDVEEWGQTVLLRVLVRYGRSFFLDPATTGTVDPDAELALKSSAALLQHLNPAVSSCPRLAHSAELTGVYSHEQVVSGVVKLHYYLAPSNRHTDLVRPLLRLLKGAPEVAAVALEDCALMAEERPDLFVDHLSTFFVRFSDSAEIRRTRLRIIIALTNESNIRVVLRELLTYIQDVDDAFSSDAVVAVGTCARRVPTVAGDCLKTLIKLLQSKHEPTIATSVLVLRSLLLSRSLPASTSRAAVITLLVSHMHSGKIQDPTARATVYWLVGQCAAEGLVEGCGPDTVRLGAKSFTQEAVPAKLQLLTLSAKLLVLSHLSALMPYLRPLSLLFDYLTTLSRYDLAYEVRDRARFLRGLIQSAKIGKEGAQAGTGLVLGEDEFRRGVTVEELGGGEGTPEREEGRQSLTGEQVRQVLFEGKTFDVEQDRHAYHTQLGTFALVLPSKRPFPSSPSSSLAFIPPYPSIVPASSIRDPPTPAPGQSPSIRPAAPLQGFGSDSFRSLSSSSLGHVRRDGKIVLVPTTTGSGSDASSMAGRREFRNLDDFYADEEGDSSEEDEDEDEDEDEGEDEDEDEGEDEDEDEEVAGSEDEEEGSGGGSEEEESEEAESEVDGSSDGEDVSRRP
ncbi:SPOSA6832_04133, partial [Sporobolomyces salmonicolor]